MATRQTAAPPAGSGQPGAHLSTRNRAWTRLRRNRAALAGAVLLLLLTGGAVLAPWVAPADPLALGLDRPYLSPGTDGHLLGTDNFGRDVFSRVLHGARISLLMGVTVVAGAALIGLTLGVVSGYFGGWVDQLIMRITDLFFAFPFLILALAVIAVLGPGTQNLVLVLALVTWPAHARLVRSRTLSLRTEPYVEAARAAGASDLRIMVAHIIPNCLAPVTVMATLGMADAILAAAGLSFLGMGVQPPAPEWGAMLNEGKAFIRAAPHMILAPGIAIMITILSLNFVGDGLRDALDPTMSHSQRRQ